MAALNIPLISWCVIVAAMTVLISVRLFKNEQRHMQPRRQGNLIKAGNEQTDIFVHGDILHERNKR